MELYVLLLLLLLLLLGALLCIFGQRETYKSSKRCKRDKIL